MPKIIWPYDHDFYPDDDAMGRHDPGHFYTPQFEQLTDIIQRREKWLLGVFGELVEIWLRILPSDPDYIPCSCYDQDYGQSKQDCYICYGTGALGGYRKLTLDKLSHIRLDQSRNHLGPIDDDGKRLISNREVPSWDESRILDSYEKNTGKWLVRFPTNSRHQELMEHGRRERESVPNCWFFSPVRLDDRDFFVRENGRRYKFTEIYDSTWRQKITHTQFTAEIVDEEDIIYQVGVLGASVEGFEESTDPKVQEQLSQEQFIFTSAPQTEGDLLVSYDFYEIYSHNRLRSRRGRR